MARGLNGYNYFTIMKICVLQPSYRNSSVDYANYDPPRELSALWPEAEMEHVFLDKALTYKQLQALKRQGFDIFVNLCEGYLNWDVPSIDVIHALDRLDLPYTGPNAATYDPSKALMKLVAWYAGVKTPSFVLAHTQDDVRVAANSLRFPLFVKPNYGGDSLGIDAGSLCRTPEELERRAALVIEEFDGAIIDEYIDGREFSVLVAAAYEPNADPKVFRPIEFVFPSGEHFKTYDLKTCQYHPLQNVPVDDPELDRRLRAAASDVFLNFGGVGYSRMDFRLDKDGDPYLLDVNFTCSVFYGEGAYGTADYILQQDGYGQAAFLRHIVAEGIERHRRSRKSWEVFHNGISGWGIRAPRALHAGNLVFRGEEKAQRIATRRHIEATWSPAQIETFRRYAYPVSEQVRILWDEQPGNWAPQNHSCRPNTGYHGLDVVALRDIAAGEELTLDYGTFCNEDMEPFDCRCGDLVCRGRIEGRPGNSVDLRERETQKSGAIDCSKS